MIGGALLLLGVIGFFLWAAWATDEFRNPPAVAVRLNLEPHMLTVLNPDGVGSVKSCLMQPITASGQPAPVANIAWTTDRPDILKITPADDGMSCKVEAVPGAPQDQNATVAVQADNVAGTRLEDSVQFNVHADNVAVSLGLTVS